MDGARRTSAHGWLARMCGALLLAGAIAPMLELLSLAMVLRWPQWAPYAPYGWWRPFPAEQILAFALAPVWIIGGSVVGVGLLRFLPWARRGAVALVGFHLVTLVLLWLVWIVRPHDELRGLMGIDIPPPLTVLQALRHLDAPRLFADLLMLVFLCAPPMRARWGERGAPGPLTRGAAAIVQRLSPAITPLAWYVALVWLIGAGWQAVLLWEDAGGIIAHYRLRLWTLLAMSYGAGLLPLLGGLLAGALLLVPRLTRVPGVLLGVATALAAPVFPLLGRQQGTDLSFLPGWAASALLALAAPAIMGYCLLREEGMRRAGGTPAAGAPDPIIY